VQWLTEDSVTPLQRDAYPNDLNVTALRSPGASLRPQPPETSIDEDEAGQPVRRYRLIPAVARRQAVTCYNYPC